MPGSHLFCDLGFLRVEMGGSAGPTGNVMVSGSWQRCIRSSSLLLHPFPRAPPPPPRQLVFAVGTNGPAFRRKCQKLSLSSFSVWVCKLRLCLGAKRLSQAQIRLGTHGPEPYGELPDPAGHTRTPSICQKEYQIGCHNRCQNSCQIERYNIWGASCAGIADEIFFPLSGDVHVDPAMPPGKLPMDSKSLSPMRLSPLTVVFLELDRVNGWRRVAETIIPRQLFSVFVPKPSEQWVAVAQYFPPPSSSIPNKPCAKSCRCPSERDTDVFWAISFVVSNSGGSFVVARGMEWRYEAASNNAS